MMPNRDAHILIVEDEQKIAAVLQDYLEAAHYQTTHLSRGDEVAAYLAKQRVDLILLDVNLPGMDGLSVCRETRAHSDVPIILVTARIDDIDRLLGLELGADDYVCKPFNPREVVARVKAILRRVQRSADSTGLSYQELTLDKEKFQAYANGVALDLTPIEFRLLQLMLPHPGRVYTREQLQDAIYTDGRIVSDRTVDSHVKNLRKKLKAHTEDERIHSIYGLGYKLE